MATHLRVFREEMETVEAAADERLDPSVRVRLGDLLPLVALAQKLNFIWLKDFLDDEVRISEDLHEVLQTFRSCKPTAS